MSDARLGLVIDSGQAKRAAVDLDALAASAANTQTATNKMSATFVAATAPAVDFTKRLTQGMSEIGAAQNAAFQANERLVAGMSTGSARAQMSVAALGNQTKQLSFQLFDIAQGIPLVFDSPRYALMNLATQTGQISQLYMGQGGLRQAFADTKQTAVDLGLSLGRFLAGPLGAVTVAAGLAVTAVAAIFLHERAEEQRAEEALKKHVDLIGRIKDAYKDAGDAATRYGAESATLLRALDVEQQRLIKEQLDRKALDISANLPSMGGPVGLAAAAGAINSKTFDALKELRTEAASGSEDWKKFGESIVKALNDPAISRGQRAIAQGLLQIAIEQAKAQASLRTMVQVSPGPMTPNLPTQNDSLLEILNQRAEMERIRRGLDADLTAITAKSPAEMSAAARAQGAAGATGHDAVEQLKIEATAALAAAQAEFQLAEARRQREASARDGLETSQLEVSLVGKGIASTAELRANWASYLELRREAEDNNVAFDEAQYERLKKLNAEAAIQVELAARRQLLSDTSFDRGQMFRSSTEQDVASKMRDIYGDDFLAHMHDFEAEQVRINDRLKQLNDIGRDLTEGAFHDFFDGLQKGEGAFQALGDAGVNALGKIEDKLISMLADQAWNAFFSQVAQAFGSSFAPGAGSAATPNAPGLPVFGGPRLVVGPSGLSNVVQFRQAPQTPGNSSVQHNVKLTNVPAGHTGRVTEAHQNSSGGFDMSIMIDAIDQRIEGKYGGKPRLKGEATSY